MLATLAVVGLLTFGDLLRALLPAAVFLGLSALEGQLITPIVLGRRLTLNPVVIFIALLLWGWIWGVPGILLAVPLLAAVKILCDNIEPLEPIGQFLGRREE
jgi:predicted PurR-regulated permease PerM